MEANWDADSESSICVEGLELITFRKMGIREDTDCEDGVMNRDEKLAAYNEVICRSNYFRDFICTVVVSH